MSWDVYRDADGKAVTITQEQCWAILHAARTWLAVAEAEDYSQAPKIRALIDAFHGAVVTKSCLMGRMLYEGRAPLDEKPPVVNAAPAYHLRDPDLCPKCGGLWSQPGRRIGASIAPAAAAFLADLYANSSGGEPMGKVRTIVECIEPRHAAAS